MIQEDKVDVNSQYHIQLLNQIRQLCLSFPETNERVSHGAPTFFYKDKKSFVQYHSNRHGDGKIALWCASTSDIQSLLVESNPEIYYLPPYVAYLGWVGLRLDRDAQWDEIKSVIGDAYLTKASSKRK
ncbi:MmcQ/YjbR family DNA-binding protein [Cohnella silvisoli]|uniref:MmcQ/YjbR family DNA-binding protein n=1 Tax=Cohnella silvisoli TaxID=2873699 RepID=A0ABV1KYW6_9BACL|nr:MmcQ/YjbR family DNA-binding protein [Cohnella silvisoli]MCD9021838.1 MmcQ/YjbR family DNA-binding protein [Cohnella silvisoli]